MRYIVTNSRSATPIPAAAAEGGTSSRSTTEREGPKEDRLSPKKGSYNGQIGVNSNPKITIKTTPFSLKSMLCMTWYLTVWNETIMSHFNHLGAEVHTLGTQLYEVSSLALSK